MQNKVMEGLERSLEGMLFASRWLLAPFYVGLALSILVLLIKFIEEFFLIAGKAFNSTEAGVILGVLSLVDLALTGSLLVIVIFSGYENFVSRIDHSKHKDWPAWMGTIDFTALKLKLLSSIVAISAIQLLKQFMDVKTSSDRDLFWYVVIHLVFVGSSVLLALSDRIAGDDHGAKPAESPPLPRQPEAAFGAASSAR
ncbi:MAG TPA: TIGR00645 family protein [Hyphomicrobiaceae bacterium]|nr:TIGR00645 family protein [Hyphomicrobiaceae bacterium]